MFRYNLLKRKYGDWQTKELIVNKLMKLIQILRNIESNSCSYEDKMSGKKAKVRTFIIEATDNIEPVMTKESHRWVRDKMLSVHNGFRLAEKAVLPPICAFLISNTRPPSYCHYQGRPKNGWQQHQSRGAFGDHNVSSEHLVLRRNQGRSNQTHPEWFLSLHFLQLIWYYWDTLWRTICWWFNLDFLIIL